MASVLSQTNHVHIVALLDHFPDNLKSPDISYTSICPGEQRIVRIILKSRGKLRRYLKENKIDIALLEGHKSSFLEVFAKPLRKTKFIACDHGAICNQMDNKTIVTMRKYGARLADHVVTLTEKNRVDYIKQFGIKESKVSCIPNWIPSDFFTNVEAYNSMSKKIMTVGRLSQEKGWDHLVQVAEKVLKKHTDWVWDIYGEGDMREFLQKSIAEKNLENRLVLKGEVDHIPALYQDYAMLVLSSYREGLPLVLLEAQAKKVPLISFDIDTGPNEIIAAGKNGYLVPPYDTREMADKINELIENPMLRQKFSDNSYLKIDRFRQENVINQWLCLFDNLHRGGKYRK